MSEFESALARLAPKLGDGPLANLKRLSGGASQETWSFDVGGEGFILRRAPNGAPAPLSGQSIGLEAEARVIKAARAADAPAPVIAHVCAPEEALGPGYVMRRLAGETLARRILRDAQYAHARTVLAAQCGAALAAIHAVEADLNLPTLDARTQLDLYEATFRTFEIERPVFELAFAELKKRVPPPLPPRLIHGDFRNGNLMVDENGLVAALDWELAHMGDPAEDMGWICTLAWRFGGIDKPVGGFGAVADLLAAYHEAGGDTRVDEARVRFWTMMGSLKWGIMCLGMYRTYETGIDPSVERAAIGRRSSENEVDLVLLLQGKL